MNWISVDDRLPKDDRDVLAISKSGSMKVGRVQDDVYRISCIKNDTCILHVTHWMPLPEPPK